MHYPALSERNPHCLCSHSRFVGSEQRSNKVVVNKHTRGAMRATSKCTGESETSQRSELPVLDHLRGQAQVVCRNLERVVGAGNWI